MMKRHTVPLYVLRSYVHVHDRVSKRRNRRVMPYYGRYQRIISRERLRMQDVDNSDVLEPFILPPCKLLDESILNRSKATRTNMFAKVNTLNDLICVLNENKSMTNEECGKTMELIREVQPELERLDAMIGLEDLKIDILHSLIYYCQGLQNKENEEYMHMVLMGNPGTGKTQIAYIIAHIFANIGILKKSHVHKVARSDLIAAYLGQTAIKTTNAVNEALDGVLFIDEAYSMGSKGNSCGNDSYSKECIDTLNEQLSIHRNRLMVILAGYENELNECFFNQNQGLRSRFLHWYRLPDYTPKHLAQIFIQKLQEDDWGVECSDVDVVLHEWFRDNSASFNNNGRDIENMITHTKMTYSWRVFRDFVGFDGFKHKITMDDLNLAFEKYKKSREQDGSLKNDKQLSQEMMYI